MTDESIWGIIKRNTVTKESSMCCRTRVSLSLDDPKINWSVNPNSGATTVIFLGRAELDKLFNMFKALHGVKGSNSQTLKLSRAID